MTEFASSTQTRQQIITRDASARPVTVSSDGPNGPVVTTYTYVAFGHLQNVSGPAGTTVSLPDRLGVSVR